MSEWMPIETAPTDSTEIIVGVDIATVWIVRSARYEDDEDFCENLEEIGWWSYSNSISQELLEGIFEPTHWMPLPKPPEFTDEKEY